MGVRWNASADGKTLASLFKNGDADPRFSKAAEINPVKELREEFKDFTKENFRNNCKTTAANWMAGKAVEGVRFKTLMCESELDLECLTCLLQSNTNFACVPLQWIWKKNPTTLTPP